MSWLHHRQLQPSCGTAAARDNKRHRDKELKQAGRELGNQARFLDERDNRDGKHPRVEQAYPAVVARPLNLSSPHLDFDLAKRVANAGNIKAALTAE